MSFSDSAKLSSRRHLEAMAGRMTHSWIPNFEILRFEIPCPPRLPEAGGGNLLFQLPLSGLWSFTTSVALCVAINTNYVYKYA